jgi:hypothetical protein
MRIQSFFIGAGVLICVWILGAQVHNSPPVQQPRPSAPQAAKDANACLPCHGPFEKLMEASAKYVAPSGEKGSPHRYVPHDSKKDADVPECGHCHTAHSLDPLPSHGSIDPAKAGVQWCYDACHHEKNLHSCKECHP